MRIEEALLRHPAVAEAAVFGFPHPSLGEDIGAAIVVRPSDGHRTRPDPRGRGSLADYKVPHRVVFVDEIEGPDRKMQRRSWPETFQRQRHGRRGRARSRPRPWWRAFGGADARGPSDRAAR